MYVNTQSWNDLVSEKEELKSFCMHLHVVHSNRPDVPFAKLI